MKIGGFDKVSLLNYPGLVACTIFTQGCNLKCPFCQNSELIPLTKSSIDEEEIFEYLNKRKNILDGVCITGGEPLIQKDIKSFIKRIKEYGYKVKLDTNGTNPILLKELIDEHLIDYVAMDIKNISSKYNKTSGKRVIIDNILKSIKLIEKSDIDYEFRTTIVKEYHIIDDIKEIRKKLNKKSKYYIQNFVDSEYVINKDLHGFTESELMEMKNNTKEIEFRDI